VQKVADASGAKYSVGNAPSSAPGPAPLVASKPVFTPTRSGAGSAYNPLGGTTSRNISRDENVDDDGWGADAPQVTRSQLEKVQSAYQPTKVNMAELTKQKQEPSRFNGASHLETTTESGEVVKGGYQPIGKVDIAAMRAQAKKTEDYRPTIVKGAYEPIGKVDIAAIRAKSQKPADEVPRHISAVPTKPSTAGEDSEESKSLADRSAVFTQSERLTSLPKPKVAHKFVSSNFTGTKAPTPGVFGLQSAPTTAKVAPVGATSRTFADEGGKTPAQIWAEKKARQRGLSGAADTVSPGLVTPITSQPSGSGEWKSGYTGKSWAPVTTTVTGRSATSSIDQQRTGEQDRSRDEEEAPASPAGGIGALRDRFKGAAPMGAPVIPSTKTGDGESNVPPVPSFSRPEGVPVGLPTRPQAAEEEEYEERGRPNIPSPPRIQRSPSPPTPEEREESPVRLAMPVSRNKEPQFEAPEERIAATSMPIRSLEKEIPREADIDSEPSRHDTARAVGVATAETTFGRDAPISNENFPSAGKRALVQYDYEKAEDNEIELLEGEYVTHIEMVDADWWMGTNSKGESGLFPSNYVELVEDDAQEEEPAPPPLSRPSAVDQTRAPAAPPAPAAPEPSKSGPTATALYDYEAAEDNELSFEENDKITGLVSFCSRSSPSRLLIQPRNSRMTIGGLVTRVESRVFSHPTMYSLMNSEDAEAVFSSPKISMHRLHLQYA